MTDLFEKLVSEYERIEPEFVQNGYSTSGLTEKDRNFLLVFMADSAINSGGVSSLWINNHGLLDTKETLEAYRKVGAPTKAEILELFIESAENTAYPGDMEERMTHFEKISKDWPDDEDLSDQYYDSDEDIDSLLVRYINEN